MAIRFKSAMSQAFQASALASMRRSVGPPRCSSTCTRLGPKPRSRNSSTTAVGLLASLLSTIRRAPLCRWALSAATGRATTESVTTSCSAHPKRAAASEKDDAEGSTCISSPGITRARLAPTPNSIGSPLASTQTGSPRSATTGASEKGLGHVRRSAPMQAGSKSSWRCPPNTRAALNSARRAVLPRPLKPSSPIPTTVSQGDMPILLLNAEVIVYPPVQGGAHDSAPCACRLRTRVRSTP